jgi:hemerythrin-like domain-containing protein
MTDGEFQSTSSNLHALGMLREEHRRIEELAARCLEADELSGRAIADGLVAEVQTHILIENDIVYPAIERIAGEPALREASEQHEQIERLTEELCDIEPADERFRRVSDALSGLLADHFLLEDESLFRALDQIGDEELVSLGQKMIERREAALTETRDHGPNAVASLRGAG